MTVPILSIIILNYNSGHYLLDCLQSLNQSISKYKFEVIVIDNASTDESLINIKKFQIKNFKLKIVLSKANLGFSAGNNFGLKSTNPKSKYVLFLNPDTIVKSNTIQKIVDFMEKNPQVSASTCKIILANTNMFQPECHRGFPTPWRSFCHFSGLSKLFPRSPLFSGYFQGHLDLTKTHQVEACVGAFILLKRTVGDKIGWWNESYFFYGEDLDLCYKLHQNNFKLFYYPHCQIVHFQGISSGIKDQSKKLSSASRLTKIKVAKASTQAMRIFYQQNLYQNYGPLTKFIVNLGISLLEFTRVFKARYL